MTLPIAPNAPSPGSALFAPVAPLPADAPTNFDKALAQAAKPPAQAIRHADQLASDSQAADDSSESLLFLPDGGASTPWLAQWLAYTQQPVTAPDAAAGSLETGDLTQALDAAAGGLPLAFAAAPPATDADDVAPARRDLAQGADTDEPAVGGIAGRRGSSQASAAVSADGGHRQQRFELDAPETAPRAVAPAVPSLLAATPPGQVLAQEAPAPAELAQDDALAIPVSGAQGVTPSTSHRADIVTAPGAPASLHGQALQGRMDEALRWMAGNGIQTARIRIDPEALGPITVHLRLDGEIASVVFASNHEQTRQALEQSLQGLKNALSENGLSLGQASVGSEQQSAFLAQHQHDERASGGSAARTGAGHDDEAGASGNSARLPAAHIARQGDGIVDLYA